MKKVNGSIVGVLVLAFGLFTVSYVHAAPDNVNYVRVTSCEEVAGGIRISRNNGPKYVLTSECRDAGHGMRNYTMSCVSRTQYKVSWTETNSCSNRDTTNPTVSLASNKSIVHNDETVTLTATAHDNKAVTKIEIYEGSAIRKTCVSTNNCSHSFTADANWNSDRTQTFTAKAYDAAGNTKTSHSVTITTRAFNDTIKPVVSISTSKTSIKTGQQVTVYASASDNKGIAWIDVYQDGERIKRCNRTDTCNSTVTLRLPSNVNAKTYSFHMKAMDVNGNTRTSDTVSVRVTR